MNQVINVTGQTMPAVGLGLWKLETSEVAEAVYNAIKNGKTVMKVNSVMGLLLAVESGVGLAALPEYLVSNSSNVIKVLPKSEGPITEAHFVYPQSLKNTARVQAFRNFLFSKIGDWK